MSKKKVIAKKKTPFNFIHVIADGPYREMWFKGTGGQDFFLQSRINTKAPYSMAMTYSQMMMGAFLFKPEPKRILIIGLGGALIPTHIAYLYPETHVDVVDVDPGVIELSKKYFYFKETSKCRAHAQDGRLFIQQRLGKIHYDIVMLDAFKSGSVPFHLKTQEFYEEIRDLLVPDGVVSSNLYGKSNSLKPHDLKTFTHAFQQTYLFEDPEQIATVLIASKQESKCTADQLRAAAKKLMAEKPMTVSLEDVANMYQPRALQDKVAFIFKDEFSDRPFKESVKNNNLDLPEPRPYTILNSYPEN